MKHTIPITNPDIKFYMQPSDRSGSADRSGHRPSQRDAKRSLKSLPKLVTLPIFEEALQGIGLSEERIRNLEKIHRLVQHATLLVATVIRLAAYLLLTTRTSCILHTACTGSPPSLSRRSVSANRERRSTRAQCGIVDL